MKASRSVKLVPLVLVVLTLLAACQSAPTATPAAEGPFDVNKFTGTYKGTWTNNTTGANGDATIVIVADPAAQTVELTIDFDGPYLGLVDPPAQTMAAKYDSQQALVEGSNPLFGDYKVTIDPDGNIIGLMKNLAGGLVPEMSYTGVVGGGRLDADYTVTLKDGKVVNSILRLTKQ